jgi:seryl-tRNA synthetase
MLDLTYITTHADELKAAVKNKQMDPSLVDRALATDTARKEQLLKVESLRRDSNAHATSIKEQGGKPTPEQIAQGKAIKQQLQELEPPLKIVEQELQELMYQLPNPPAADVPIGKDESGNQVVKTHGTLPEFNFEPKPHHVLMENLDLLDTKRAVAIAGFRAYFLKNQAVALEQALLQHALKLLTKQDFTPMTVPWMVNKDALWGTGYFPWGIEDHYTTQDDQGLIGTAEVSLTAYHQGEVLSEKQLPIKMVGVSPCFRREVGSYGKDVQGIIRVHQFTKVEQVVYTVADEEETRKWHQQMVEWAEQLLQELELPYHVLLMCTGDMGAGQRKKYDIETWFPSQKTYRETHSASYFNDFQARRLNIRYQAKDGSLKHVYTLNNTMAASPRLLAALIENYQQEDGSIRVPKVLQEAVGYSEIRKQ